MHGVNFSLFLMVLILITYITGSWSIFWLFDIHELNENKGKLITFDLITAPCNNFPCGGPIAPWRPSLALPHVSGRRWPRWPVDITITTTDRGGKGREKREISGGEIGCIEGFTSNHTRLCANISISLAWWPLSKEFWSIVKVSDLASLHAPIWTAHDVKIIYHSCWEQSGY